MKTNSQMAAALVRGPTKLNDELPPDLHEVASAGWVVGPCGAILLRALWGSGWRNSIAPSEIGAYEYEVNEVYGSLSDLAFDRSTYLNKAAARGLSFAVRMLKGAAALPGAESLTATVSIPIPTDEEDEDFPIQGVTIRFFSCRGDYPAFFQDLERYQTEAMAVVDMGDVRARRTEPESERGDCWPPRPPATGT